jgi:hypothetical protein
MAATSTTAPAVPFRQPVPTGHASAGPDAIQPMTETTVKGVSSFIRGDRRGVADGVGTVLQLTAYALRRVANLPFIGGTIMDADPTVPHPDPPQPPPRPDPPGTPPGPIDPPVHDPVPNPPPPQPDLPPPGTPPGPIDPPPLPERDPPTRPEPIDPPLHDPAPNPPVL